MGLPAVRSAGLLLGLGSGAGGPDWQKTFRPYLMISDQPVNSRLPSLSPCAGVTVTVNSEVSLNMKPTVRCREFCHISLTLSWPIFFRSLSLANSYWPPLSFAVRRCVEGDKKYSEMPVTVTFLSFSPSMPSSTSKIVKNTFPITTGSSVIDFVNCILSVEGPRVPLTVILPIALPLPSSSGSPGGRLSLQGRVTRRSTGWPLSFAMPRKRTRQSRSLL
mmetsp:Transcript_35114/g.111624  ORF Transcript_35114/g.111624 Transcript_35114/m.111624 type:complete len:219 (+) Transcript_35114:110-766(+)